MWDLDPPWSHDSFPQANARKRIDLQQILSQNLLNLGSTYISLSDMKKALNDYDYISCI